VDAYARTCARIVAPRSRARSPSSSTSTPAPSPITKPSRRASKGRETPVGESASRAAKEARASGTSAASDPPVTAASAPPHSISRAASPIAWAPAAQADSVAKDGPRRVWRMLTAPAPALPIIRGMASGETLFSPCSSSTWWLWVSVPMPPIPVPMMQPIRVGS